MILTSVLLSYVILMVGEVFYVWRHGLCKNYNLRSKSKIESERAQIFLPS